MAVQQTRRALAPTHEEPTPQGAQVRQRDRHYLHLQRLQAAGDAPEERRLASFDAAPLAEPWNPPVKDARLVAPRY